MPPKRDDDDKFIEMARVAREVRERDEKPSIFDFSNWLFRGGQILVVIGCVWGVAIAFANYNHRLVQQDARIRRLERQVVHTTEWRAWREVFQLTNKQIVVPDPKDYTTDRTE